VLLPAGLPVPATWRDLLEELAPVFARRSAHRGVRGAGVRDDAGRSRHGGGGGSCGRDRRGVAAGVLVFRGAVWDVDELGLAVAGLMVRSLLAGGEPVVVAVDGTFFNRWGREVFEARRGYDGSAQGGRKVASGTVWVVAALVVRLALCSSPVALPVLFRLWRGKGTAAQVELAAAMPGKLAAAFPGRQVHRTGDAAFPGQPLVRQGVTGTARRPANAVLYRPKPPRTGRPGRPRVTGDRLGSCAQIAQAANWTDAVSHGSGQDASAGQCC
jgi:hypothetical protein